MERTGNMRGREQDKLAHGALAGQHTVATLALRTYVTTLLDRTKVTEEERESDIR
jgi:hypothetical protein